MNKKTYEIYKLKNGLTIVFIPLVQNIVNNKKCLKNNKYIDNIGINLLLPVGSRHENEKNSGISHILEHASFRQKYDEKLSIMRKLQINGSIFNAETSLEYTHYYIISDKKYLDDNLKIMSNILLNLDFDESEIEKEKRVVLEEYFMGKDNVKNLLMESLLDLLVNKKHPIKKPVIGTLENIKTISIKDLQSYKSKHYNTNTAVLVISGNYDKNNIINKSNDIFNKTRIGNLEFPVPLNCYKSGLKIKTLYKKGYNHTYFCLGFNSINLYDKDMYMYDVLSQILKTKLFLSLRESNGLTYTSNVLSSHQSDFGIFGIVSSVMSVFIYKTIYLILELLHSLKSKVIEIPELESAKATIENGNNMELTSILNHNRIYGFQKLYDIDKIETPNKYLEKINKVTPKDILKISKKMFNVNNMLFVAVGSLANDKNLQKLLSLLKN
jgi:hypothetical protein